MVKDRREFQRLRLAKPILAQLDGQNALILDVGVSGALVEHYGEPKRGTRVRLSFRWKGEEVAFNAEVRRSNVIRRSPDAVSHTGLHFLTSETGSEERLNDMMATFVGRVLAAQWANVRGDYQPHEEVTLAQLGAARRSRVRGWLTYRFKDGVWTRTVTDSPQQPEDGFTVAGFEAEEELEELCRTFEHADEEGRRLIRLVAELSAKEGKT